MRYVLIALTCALGCNAARAEPVFEFVERCEAAPLSVCFNEIRADLDRLRAADDRHSFCLPPVWGGFVPSKTYPVSVLDYVKLRLSAARIGRAGDPTDAVLRDVLADMFPCRAPPG